MGKMTEYEVKVDEVCRRSAVSAEYVERIHLVCSDDFGSEASIWLYFEPVPRIFSKRGGIGIASEGQGPKKRHWIYRDPAEFRDACQLLESERPSRIAIGYGELQDGGPTAELITSVAIHSVAT